MKELPTSVLESRLRMLSDEKCQAIYDAALTIISEMGMTRAPTPRRVRSSSRAPAPPSGDDLVKDPARCRSRCPRHHPRDDPRVRPRRRARHAARRLQLVLRYRLRPHEHLRLRDQRASPERARRHRPHGPPLRRPAQHRLHHVVRAPQRHRAASLLPRELPRHGQQHHQADGHDRRRRRGPRSHVEDRLRVPRRRRGAARQAVLHPVRRAGQPAAARPRGPRQSCSSAPTGASRSSTRRRRSPAPRRRSPSPATSCRPSPSRSSASSSTSCAGRARRCSPAWAPSSST